MTNLPRYEFSGDIFRRLRAQPYGALLKAAQAGAADSAANQAKRQSQIGFIFRKRGPERSKPSDAMSGLESVRRKPLNAIKTTILLKSFS
jgi:hypothetical protein